MSRLPEKISTFYWYFIKRPIVFFMFFLVPLSIILEVNVVPYALKLFVDAAVSNQNDRQIIVKEMISALWLGGSAWFGSFVILRLQGWWQAYVIPRFEADIRITVLNHVSKHSCRYFFNQLSGDLAGKIEDLPRSMEVIRNVFSWNIVPSLAVTFVALALMGSIKPFFSVILGGWIIIHLVLCSYFAKFINKISKKNAMDKNIVRGNIVDFLNNIVLIKLFSRNTYELTHIKNVQHKEKITNSRLLLTMNLFQLVIHIPIIAMLVSIAYLLVTTWQQETISTGDFIFITNTVFAIMYQIWNLSHSLTTLFREVGVVQQALTLINHPYDLVDVPNALPISVNRGEIAFHNVTFGYTKEKNIFENKNVTIRGGEKVGLVGYSGSGKSTFVNLILRFYDLQSGIITIDGQDIAKVTQDSLRENIVMIPQETLLFHRSIMDNIRYGKIEATDSDVIEVAKKAYCHDFITQLPNGYDTLVGERGIKLSGGQRQRIAIARAMLKTSTILILDEATSALDSLNEKYAQKALQDLMHDCTTLIIAHRLSTLLQMDRLLVFNNGRIIEDGSHEELLKLNGHYALMWDMQSDSFLINEKEYSNTPSHLFDVVV